MPLIEGIGDEVTLVFGVLVLVMVVLLAWLSTHTDDMSLFREVGVIVVELSQRGTLYRNNRAETAPEAHAGSTEQTDTGNSPPSPEASDETITETSSSVEDAASSRVTDSLVNAEDLGHQSEASHRIPDPRTLQAATQKGTDEENTNRERDSNTLTSNNIVHEEEVVASQSESSTESSSDFPLSGEEVRQRRVQYFQGDGLYESQVQSSSCRDGTLPLDTEDRACLRDFKTEERLSTSPTKSESSSNTNQSLSQETDITENQSVLASSNEASVSDVSQESLQQPGTSTDNLSNSQICVKLRYVNETQRFVFAKPDDTIGDFRRTHFQSELEDNKWVRFIFNGQDLRDDARTLQACNVVNNSTMHCLVTSLNRSQPQHEAAVDEEDDSMLGTLMYPLFTVMLAVVWYFRFTYRQYFSAMSTVCLIGISFILVLSYISSFRMSDSHETQQPQQPAQSASSPGNGNPRQQDSNVH